MHLSSLLGDLDRLHQSFICFGVWDLEQHFDHLPWEWGGDQDLSLFLRGGGGGSSFVFLFDGTSSSEDSLSLLELLDDDDESSNSGFVVCYADCFNLEEGSDEPSPAEPRGNLWTFLQLECAESCTGHFNFEEGLGGPSPAEPRGDLSTL